MLPTINKRLVPNYTPANNRKLGLCLHHAATVTKTLDEIYRTFMNRAASTKWAVAAGRVDEYLPDGVYEWAAGDAWANAYLEHIEVANSTGAPNWDIDEGSIDTLIDLMVWRFQVHPEWGQARWGINVFQHKDFSATFCAGQVGQRGEEICRRVNERLSGIESKEWIGMRLAGNNRYGTNSAVVTNFEKDYDWSKVVIFRDGADGYAIANIPDKYPKLMVNDNPDSNGGEKAILARHKGEIKELLVIGGLKVLPDAVINRLNEAAGL